MTQHVVLDTSKTYYIVYRWSCSITNRTYWGQHKVDPIVGEDDGYISSCDEMNRAYAMYPDSWRRDILDRVQTREEALAREKLYVSREMIKSPTVINRAEGGRGSWDHVNALPNEQLFTEERKENMRLESTKQYKKRKHKGHWKKQMGPSNWKSYDYEQHSKNMSGGSNSAAKSITLVNPYGTSLSFSTMKEASEETGIPLKALRRIVNPEKYSDNNYQEYRDTWKGVCNG